jgi:hypothetical protein
LYRRFGRRYKNRVVIAFGFFVPGPKAFEAGAKYLLARSYRVTGDTERVTCRRRETTCRVKGISGGKKVHCRHGTAMPHQQYDPDFGKGER